MHKGSQMNIGIVGYGGYVPRYRITVEEIATAHNQDGARIAQQLGVQQKSVPGKDEDSLTIALQAATYAIARATVGHAAPFLGGCGRERPAINICTLPKKIQALYVGSESHPYAVKPSATVIGAALGVSPFCAAANIEFACKGGTAALLAAADAVAAGRALYALAIGSDTAQAAPGDILEYTAAAGGAAFVLGSTSEDCCAYITKTMSLCSDTPDFWRREGQKYPEHLGRFTGTPSYMHHLVMVTNELLSQTKTKPTDFDYVIFHQPNKKFPEAVAQQLGFTPQQYKPGLLVDRIGNTYSASSLLGFTAVLDIAAPGQKILLVSYGSGAGCDGFIFTIADGITKKQTQAPHISHFMARTRHLSYHEYCQHTAHHGQGFLS